MLVAKTERIVRLIGRMRCSLHRLLPVSLLALAALPLCAQDAPSTDAPPPKKRHAKAQEDILVDPNTLKVQVNLVDVYFSARDHNGFVTGLGRNDCQLFWKRASCRTSRT